MSEIKLYKRNLKGNLQTWEIEKFINDEGHIYAFVIKAGLERGRKVNTPFTNPQAFPHGMDEEIRRRVQCQIERNGYSTTVPKERPFSPMLAHEYYEGMETTWPKYVQPKLDGVRCYLTKDGAFSRRGVKYTSINHITLPTDETIIDGELYHHGSSLQEISGWARGSDQQPKLKHIAFDLFNPSQPTLPFSERIRYLRETEYFQANTHFTQDVEILETLWEVYVVRQNYEGLILREPEAPYVFGRTSNLLKYKHTNTEDFPIVEVRQKALGKVVAICRHRNGHFETTFIGDTATVMTYLDNPPKTVTVTYAGLTNDGLPYHARAIPKED